MFTHQLRDKALATNENLTKDQEKVLSRIVEEELKDGQKVFHSLLKGVQEAGKIKRGESAPARVFAFTPGEIKAIRQNLGLSQQQFSKFDYVSIKTLQNWEQGRRQPRGPALALLMILKKDPKHALKALN